MDFMHDQLSEGRSCRLFNVNDGFHGEGAIDVGISLPTTCVISSLNRCGKPKTRWTTPLNTSVDGKRRTI